MSRDWKCVKETEMWSVEASAQLTEVNDTKSATDSRRVRQSVTLKSDLKSQKVSISRIIH